MKTCLMLLCCVQIASATMIQWYSAPNQDNTTETGVPMDESFRFELGVFKDGFVPTAENIAEWSAHWVAAQRVMYHAENNWFTGALTVEDNAAPFSSGTQAWIWGFTGDPAEGEWILFRRHNWRWPSSNANRPIPLIWDTAQANEILIGDVNAGGTQLMRAGKIRNVVPPTTTWAQWLAEEALEPGPAALMEYATGSADASMKMGRNADGTLALTVPRRADRPADFLIEVSESLSNPEWKPAGPLARLVQESPTGLFFQSDFEDVTSPRLFFRFRVFPSVDDVTP